MAKLIKTILSMIILTVIIIKILYSHFDFIYTTFFVVNFLLSCYIGKYLEYKIMIKSI
jgi:hypothetical protein